MNLPNDEHIETHMRRVAEAAVVLIPENEDGLVLVVTLGAKRKCGCCYEFQPCVMSTPLEQSPEGIMKIQSLIIGAMVGLMGFTRTQGFVPMDPANKWSEMLISALNTMYPENAEEDDHP